MACVEMTPPVVKAQVETSGDKSQKRKSPGSKKKGNKKRKTNDSDSDSEQKVTGKEVSYY